MDLFDGANNITMIKNIFQNMPSGIVCTDLKGNILIFNSVMEEITDIKSENMINKPIEDFVKQLKLSGFDYKEVVAKKAVKKRLNSFGYTPDGKELFLGFTLAPLTGLNGSTEGVMAIFADLTQIRKMEEEQKKLAHLAIIGEMSAKLAHEIKNPLASIIIGIQLLKKQSADYQNNNYFDMIISEIQRIDDLVKELLTYSKTAIPRMNLVNMPSVIKNVLDISDARIQHTGIKVIKNFSNDGLDIVVDESAIHQALLNILNNALDAMPKGGTLRINVSTLKLKRNLSPDIKGPKIAPYQDVVRIEVKDTGIGIQKSHMDKIFTPFFSTKVHGTGLGLSIVKNIIEENMGKLHIESEVDIGTAVSILFLQGSRKPCYEEVNCPLNEREQCEVFIKKDIYRCFKYKEFMAGCSGHKCIECEVYLNGCITV